MLSPRNGPSDLRRCGALHRPGWCGSVARLVRNCVGYGIQMVRAEVLNGDLGRRRAPRPCGKPYAPAPTGRQSTFDCLQDRVSAEQGRIPAPKPSVISLACRTTARDLAGRTRRPHAASHGAGLHPPAGDAAVSFEVPHGPVTNVCRDPECRSLRVGGARRNQNPQTHQSHSRRPRGPPCCNQPSALHPRRPQLWSPSLVALSGQT
jgi:hypothetical protein